MKKLTLLSIFIFLLPLSLDAQNMNESNTERSVLIEVFTSTTCPPCRPAANALQNWLNNYTHNDRVTIIKYPVWGPGAGCVFYHQNPQPVLQRNTFYGGIAGVPQGFVDGVNSGHSVSSWINRVNNRINIASPVRIDISANIVDDEIFIDAYVENVSGQDLPDNVSLRVGIVEKSINYSAPNGSTVQRYVHRNMPGGAAGVPVDVFADEYLHVTFVDEIDSNWDADNLKVVAFLQLNELNRIVYQSADADILSFPGTASQVFPENGATSIPLTAELEWASMSGSQAYDVEISTNANLHNPQRHTALTSNTIEVELEESTTYYWRVRYWYEGNHSAWSETKSFETASTTSAQVPGDLPNVVKLHQNYPNPFNPTTNIVFELTEASSVLLEVYTIDGRKVATLLNQSMQAGTHQHTFDASDLSSGVYMYRLQAGTQVLTRTMTLVK